MATIMYPSLTKSQSMRSKRKSAVEMLAESKAFYVKSETVRDSQQVLPLRIGPCSHTSFIRSKPANITTCIPQHTIGGWRPVSMPQYMAVSPSRSLPPLRVSNGRRSTSACSDVLQNKLRKLLNTDSRENISSNNNDCLVDDFRPISPPAEYAITERSSYRYGHHQSSPDHRVVHKSLPDLHTQQQQQSGGTRESCSNRSASNKSLSNRDSGESSGHYTHRSEPAPCSEPPRPEIRRDSGSSTQHSGASIYCCAADQDAHAAAYARTTRYGYPPPIEYTRTYEYANQPYQDPTLSPGPGTFKRQKCFRYKQRERERSVETARPILRSKSDISDRYWRGAPIRKQPLSTLEHSAPVSHLEQFFEQLGLNSDSYESMLDNSCESASPVFFSDVSTVDSSRPLENPEYCASQFRPSEPPSIVERNARIIKWLCNCRKLQVTNS